MDRSHSRVQMITVLIAFAAKTPDHGHFERNGDFSTVVGAELIADLDNCFVIQRIRFARAIPALRHLAASHAGPIAARFRFALWRASLPLIANSALE